jgi:hypothetical protein
MLWVLLTAFIALSCVLIYPKRYTSKRKIKGLYFVQFYYLAIAAPLAAVFLINLATDIVNRPEVSATFIPTDLLYSLYILCVVVGAIGSGIHSTSTSVYETFGHEKHSEAFKLNERFHMGVSHTMLYVACVFAMISLALLELNHPITGAAYPYKMTIPFGIVIGLMFGIPVVWSTIIRYTMISALIGTSIIGVAFMGADIDMRQVPFAVICATTVSTAGFVLLLSAIIYKTSERFTYKLIKLLFPRNHTIYKLVMAEVDIDDLIHLSRSTRFHQLDPKV